MNDHFWMEKFKSGEFLYSYVGFSPILIGGMYSENIGIGEEKFTQCTGWYSGIGDVEWWVASELDKLSATERDDLLWICKYKTYLKTAIYPDLVKMIASIFNCDTFHIYRLGNQGILQLIKDLNKHRQSILNASKNCRDPKTDKFRSDNNFDILDFNEFKIKELDKIYVLNLNESEALRCLKLLMPGYEFRLTSTELIINTAINSISMPVNFRNKIDDPNFYIMLRDLIRTKL